jgi:hypothetical protein
MSENNYIERIEYWLHSLNAKVPESNIILVGTHYDIKNREIPNEIISKFKQVTNNFYFYFLKY